MPVATGKFPKLSTDRLNLRLPTPKDAAVLRGWLSIAAVTRFSNWPDAPSQIQCERYARWMSGLHSSGKGCAWIIEDRSSKTGIGAIRFNSFHKKWKYGEIGYELHPDCWGRGLMTEALGTVVACGSRDLQAQPDRSMDAPWQWRIRSRAGKGRIPA